MPRLESCSAFNSLFSSFIQRCPKWSSLQHKMDRKEYRPSVYCRHEACGSDELRRWTWLRLETSLSSSEQTTVPGDTLPFSSEQPPLLVWGQSAPSQWGSSQCGRESSCRGWCGHGRGRCASSSWGPCWPGCARWPENPHLDPVYKNNKTKKKLIKNSSSVRKDSFPTWVFFVTNEGANWNVEV